MSMPSIIEATHHCIDAPTSTLCECCSSSERIPVPSHDEATTRHCTVHAWTVARKSLESSSMPTPIFMSARPMKQVRFMWLPSTDMWKSYVRSRNALDVRAFLFNLNHCTLSYNNDNNNR